MTPAPVPARPGVSRHRSPVAGPGGVRLRAGQERASRAEPRLASPRRHGPPPKAPHHGAEPAAPARLGKPGGSGSNARARPGRGGGG